jgi:flagellar hook-length control protein FliK
MQTSPLPSLNAGANVNGAPNRGADGDSSQFSAALSREIDHRSQLATPAPAAAPQPAQRQARADSKPAPAPKQQESAAPAQGQPATDKPVATDAAGTAPPEDAKDATDAADAADSATAPITDMLALVASFQHQLKKDGPASATEPAAQAGGRTATSAATTKGSLLQQDGAAPALPNTAAPADAAIRFAALMRGGQHQARADAPAANAADAGAAARGKSLPAQGELSPSQAPLSAAGVATGAASGSEAAIAATSAPSAAPVAALEADLKQLAAAAQRADMAHDQPVAVQAAAQLQQAAPVVAQAVAASEHLPARVGTPNWDNQVGQKIVWMVAGGEQTASLTLNPPDLGPMQVVLSVNGDQASVAFSANQQEVRNALENALPRLREMMGESGLSLGSATVSAGMPDQRQAQGDANGSSGSGGRHRGNGGASTEEAAVPRVSGRTTIIGDRGMVDTFA